MADLEQRIKRLEGELAILKNQIQMTLLDVQAELAAHYYPELRSAADRHLDAPTAVARQAPAPQVAQAARAAHAAPVSAALQAATPTLDEADLDEDGEPVRMVKVSLQDVHEHAPRPRQAEQRAAAAPATAVSLATDDLQAFDRVAAEAIGPAPRPVAPSPVEPIISMTLQASVMRWAGETVAVLGKEQTRGVIALCAEDGRIEAKLAERLTRMLDLGAAFEPEELPSFDAVLNAMVELGELLDRR